MNKFLLVSVAAGLVYFAVEMFKPTKYEEAVAVMSPCGIYAMVTLDNKGTLEVYDADNALPETVFEGLLQLEEDKRHSVIVPCPPAKNDIQAQNR